MSLKEHSEMKMVMNWKTVMLKNGSRSIIHDCCVPVHPLITTAGNTELGGPLI